MSEILTSNAAMRGGTAPEATSAPRDVLTFRLGAEEYGVDIVKVVQIRSYEQPTRVANAPSFLRGVVNLRGVIVPIIDLRLKFGCEKAELNGHTVVIVLNLHGRAVGAVVDSVVDVLELSTDAVKPAPALSSNAFGAGQITAVASVGDRRLILMDIDKVMTSGEPGWTESRPH